MVATEVILADFPGIYDVVLQALSVKLLKGASRLTV